MTTSAIKMKQLILLGGLLLLEGNVAPASVAFLLKSYLDLSNIDAGKSGLTIKRMSDNYECKPQSGKKHVVELTRNNVLIRNDRGRYQFNWEYLSRLNNLDQINF